ncbi:hypothetical protein [Campylobacter avium]|nr:hypothetical protein [Campylobacter avium]
MKKIFSVFLFVFIILSSAKAEVDGLFIGGGFGLCFYHYKASKCQRR